MTLQELLGEELYKQVQAKLDEVNGKEPDKLKHIRYADLSEGNYVGKGKYDADIEKLNNLISGKDAELTTANTPLQSLRSLQRAMRMHRVRLQAMNSRCHSYRLN